jgi:predicted transposase YbfD/YdcC
METPPTHSIMVFFADMPDPRVNRRRCHLLTDILTLSLCAVICGAEGGTEIEEFAKAREPFFRTFLELPNGIPSHDTFGRVLAALDPQAFAQCFVAWVAALCEDLAGEIVPIDGKTLRRSMDRTSGKNPLHLVSAWASETGLSLGQVATTDKSNEITAIPLLLKLLNIRGATVTIDAMGCQTAIAGQIIEQEGDYVLAVKDNQPKLREDVERVIGEVRAPINAAHCDYFESVEKGHGRIEKRRVWCTSKADWMREEERWPGLAGAAMVESERTVDGMTTTQQRYYIVSQKGVRASRVAHVIRSHWGIENQQHWVLDMAFDEDHSRTRMGNADQNLALLRKIALNLLKHEKTTKVGIKVKRKKAGWDPDYLLKVLAVKI